MNETILPGLLTASARLAILGRKNSQLALNNYAAHLAGTDNDLWQIIFDTARRGGNDDMMRQCYPRLRDSFAALPDPAEAARRRGGLSRWNGAPRAGRLTC